MNRIRLVIGSLFIILVFGISACGAPAPAAVTSTPAPASALTPTLSAIQACEADKIDIAEVHWFREPDGAWRVVGMMHNNSPHPIAKVITGVETFDKNGKPANPGGAEGEDVSAYPLNLLPGGQAPFTAWIKREIPNLDHFVIEKDDCVVTEPAERIQVQERGGRWLVDDAGLAQVSAEVFNPGPQPALVNGMMVAVFDASDKLLTADYANVTPRILAPGESGPVRATLALPPGGTAQIKSYKLYMDALVVAPSPTLLDAQKDIRVETETIDDAGHFHLVGTITNSGSKNLMASVQATVYTDPAKSAVADAAFFNTLIPLAPGENLPFDLTDWGALNGQAGLWDSLSGQKAAVVLRVEPFRTWATDTAVASLTVMAQPPVFSAGQALFTGQVKNETGRNVILGNVTVVLRDKQSGKIVAAGQTPLDIVNKLAPGETLHYTVVILLGADFGPQTVEYTVSAWGQQP